MDNDLFKERRWQLFKQICDKQNLDVRGDSIMEYRINFESAFQKANNITLLFEYFEKEEDKETEKYE